MVSKDNRPLLLLDLDYTLFDTDRFIRDMAALVASKTGIPAAEYLRQVPDHYQYNGEHLAYYQFSNHLGALGLREQFIEEQVEPDMTRRDYTYPDVPGAIEDFLGDGYDIRILTYGERRYQQLKLKCAGHAGQLAAYITLESKGSFIARQFAGRSGAIIDDKQIPDLPRAMRAIYIDRKAGSTGLCHDLHEARLQLMSKVS